MREEHARNDLTRRAVRALAEIGAGLRFSSARHSSQDSDAAARSWLNGDEARKFVFNALVIVLVLVFAAVVAKATMKRGIVIEPVSVPKELSDRGYTAEVVAQQIIDEISSVVAGAETSRELGSVSMLSPERPTPKVELPGSGISIAAVIYYLREFLGVYDTKITGDVTHEREKDGSLPATPRYLLRVRIADPFFRYVAPASSRDIAALFRDAALPVLEQINPYIAGLTYLHKQDYVKASRMAQISLRSPVEVERQWGHNLRGAIAAAKSRFSEAKSEYAGTVLNNSGFRLGQYNVASVAIAEKQYAEALELSLSALSVDDDRRRRALGYHNAGMALERMRSGKFKFQSNATLTALLDRFFG